MNQPLTHRTYLALALPLIISTITTPLLGAVDTAVIGQLGDPALLGGVAIGTMIFNTMYWLFGFLRVSTSGFTAQAHGASNRQQELLALFRPFLLALAAGIAFILLQKPIEALSYTFIQPSDEVRSESAVYFFIRIWGAPLALLNYVILGWLMGLSRVKATLVLQLVVNLTNIGLDLLFVKGFHLGVEGVAWATLIAEILGCLIGIILVIRYFSEEIQRLPFANLFDPVPFKRMLSVNRDLFIRTICLLVVFNLFTAKGAQFGTEVLAANAVLLQIHFIMAYFFDGLANASSIYTGRSIGMRDKALYHQTLKLSVVWGMVTSFILSGIYLLGKKPLISLFTQSEQVVDLALKYGKWIAAFPVAASLGLVMYGVFTGATEAAPVRNSMAASLVVFLAGVFLVIPFWENHGLWLSFLLFSAGRSIFLLFYIKSLTQKLFPERGAYRENSSFNSKLHT